ncbi:MAG TPA: hypothetical protein VLW51_05205 [Solirubrobacteraceae bacterium]|nr:hypothetical protein [Solirubrobacteraceae bacterium]
MTYVRKHLKLVTVAAACVAIGAAASAIATAGAASSGTTTTSTTAKAAGARGAGVRALERRAVQAKVVVATKSGFASATVERGFVQSVSGQQLTIREGTKKATYKTVRLTIPSNATVRDNRQASTLSALTAGQRVAVVQAPQRTWVVARTVSTP